MPPSKKPLERPPYAQLSDAELAKIKEAMALLKQKSMAQIEKYAADNKVKVDNAFIEKLLSTFTAMRTVLRNC